MEGGSCPSRSIGVQNEGEAGKHGEQGSEEDLDLGEERQTSARPAQSNQVHPRRPAYAPFRSPF
jgi:hypothetical protein